MKFAKLYSDLLHSLERKPESSGFSAQYRNFFICSTLLCEKHIPRMRYKISTNNIVPSHIILAKKCNVKTHSDESQVKVVFTALILIHATLMAKEDLEYQNRESRIPGNIGVCVHEYV